MVNSNDEQNKDYVVRCLLAEYEAWSKFLHINWQQRFVLVGLNIAALSTLLSIAITNSNLYVPFLFLTCFITSVVGLVWVAEIRWAITIMDDLEKKCVCELRRTIGVDNLFLTNVKPTTSSKNTPIKHTMQGKSPVAFIGVFIFFFPGFISWILAITSLISNSSTLVTTEIILDSFLAVTSVILLGYLVWNGIQIVKDWQTKN